MKKINLSREKIVMSITIGIACLALMLVMFMQFKVVKQTDITSIESMREEELRTELADYRKKYSEIQEKYEETISKITEYQTEKESDEKTAKLPAQVFTYTFGIVSALIFGLGMCLAMKVIGEGTSMFVIGIIIGVIGMALMGINYPIYKKILENSKKKYAYDIIALAKEISEKE